MNAFDKNMLGNSPEFRAVTRSAQIVAATDVTVLILGESGTGKELLARALHQESRRADGPFVAINAAALPDSLAESELFGHRKGSFTGADSDNPGRIRAADGGTLFLDEVGELPLNIQAKLLRFIECGECQSIGESLPRKVNTRIVAATNRDLYAQVKKGFFREDLYYRLNVVPLELPPLRQRSGDLEPLLTFLTLQAADQFGLERPVYTAETMEALKRYKWPGNIRELRNFCERMAVLFSGRTVGPCNLPREIQQGDAAALSLFTLPDSGIRLEELEKQIISQALAKTRGNRSRAARLLGLTRDTLLYRIKKYALGDA